MKNFWKDFKAFILRGNILDMAVGVIIGGAFSAIVTSLTNKILMPIVNAVLAPLTGGEKIYTILWASERVYSANQVATMTEEQLASASAAYTLGPDGGYYSKLFYIDWSNFIEAIINFIFIALTLFIIVRVAMNVSKKRAALKAKLEEKKKADEAVEEAPVEEAPAAEPTPDPVVVLLTEIRDQLKDQNARIEKLEEKKED